jgi:hypothetical protein
MPNYESNYVSITKSIMAPSVARGKCANRTHMHMLNGLVRKETQELVGDMAGHE